VPEALSGRPLDGVVRELLGVPWSEARKLIETGKIAVGDEVVTDTTRRTRAGSSVALRMRAPLPKTARVQRLGEELIVYVDPSVVVVRKPAGISTVPYGDESPTEREETLDALVRELLARRDHVRGRAPLGVVQRLDKVTSGLIVFARSFAAKKHLGQQLRVHSVHRVYLAIAHGDVARPVTHRSRLIADRGDGLRGSLGERELRGEGQMAVTHVTPVERLRGATLVACRLETGRTHQIRIHLAESGHPLVGERVYVRDYAGPTIEAPRLMLHAAELGFDHPADDRKMLFKEPPPEDFQAVLAQLRAG
jgi:23S rRNA pseudouridine1911/1915/1917 synthase